MALLVLWLGALCAKLDGVCHYDLSTVRAERYVGRKSRGLSHRPRFLVAPVKVAGPP